MYSELNFLWEAWLKVFTNNRTEAIENKAQGRSLDDYRQLMTACFKEAYRVLKPGRWMTVEFSNTKASVWNAIQTALQEAGFIVANVAALDKKQGSFKAVTSTTAVKAGSGHLRLQTVDGDDGKAGTRRRHGRIRLGVRPGHLAKLPVFIGKQGEAVEIMERTPRVLFDRMVTYHVQRGLPVPLSSGEFQEELSRRFPMRDGMVFLETQVAEYDKKRILAKEFIQGSILVTDEASAIERLRQLLLKKPQTYAELNPVFFRDIQYIAKHEKLPELAELLEQNFLQYRRTGRGAQPDPQLPQQKLQRSAGPGPPTIRDWSPRRRGAGMCPIPTSRPTWRNCGNGPCCGNSNIPGRDQGEQKALAQVPHRSDPRRV